MRDNSGEYWRSIRWVATHRLWSSSFFFDLCQHLSQQRAVFELAGGRDVLAKSLGSNNHLNVTKATLEALGQLRTKEEALAIRKG